MRKEHLAEVKKTKNWNALKETVYAESRVIIKDLKEALGIFPWSEDSIVYKDLIGTNINNLKLSVKLESYKIDLSKMADLEKMISIFNSIIKKYDLSHEVKFIRTGYVHAIRFHIYFLFSDL